MTARTPTLSLHPLLLGAVLTLCGCDAGTGGREIETRAVVIGIDGADWKIIDALSDQGLMPNLTRLCERGASGPIETLSDIPLSPVIWTSVATGKTAAKHGIAWFMVDQADGTRVPVRSHNRKTEALWNILAQRDLRATVVGWWATYPAEDVGPGAIVSDALGFHGFGSTAREGDDRLKTYPPELFERLDTLVPPEQQVPLEFVQRFVHLSSDEYRKEMFDPARYPKRDPFNPIHLFQEYTVTAQGYTAIAEDLLVSRESELFMVYFEQIDSFSHLFMKYAPPKLDWIDSQGFERYRDTVAQWYQYQDELLGRVLAKIDLERTAVFVLSDHGFKSGERRIRSEQVVDTRKAHLDHETDGIFIAAGPHIRAGAKIEGASVLDLTPTVLHYLGLAVAKDMDGKVLSQVFETDFMTRRPIAYVGTYEESKRERASPTLSSDSDSAQQTEVEAGLQALGYMGSGEADGEPQAEASSPEQHNGLGRIHLRDGEPEKALAEFQKALELDANNAEALLNISAIHQAKGRTDLAQHFVEQALQVDPNSIGALAQLAEVRRDQGDLEEAIRLFGEALAIDDSQPSLYMGIGDVLQRAGHLEDAEKAFMSVLELEPDSYKARYNLGVTYTNMDRVEEAIAQYEDALEIQPDHPEASATLNNLGAIFLAAGETDRALEKFEAAVAASPYNLNAHYNVAIIYLDRDRVERAIELLEQAAKLQPNHEQVSLRLGLALMRGGRGDDAYKSLLLVRRLYPKNWGATVALAALHSAAEDADTARKLLDEALQAGAEDARAFAANFPALQGLLAQ
jgi:tetratricopeptide (TPR) repeat protein/predicted AlkP superfamily phosphohydrolase/phosphomutase